MHPHLATSRTNPATPLVQSLSLPPPTQVIACFVFLNLIVAVILDQFTALGSQNPDLVTAQDLAYFSEAWAVFDPDVDQVRLKRPPPAASLPS